MAKKLDRETKKVFEKGDKIKSLVENSGWVIARELLLKKVAGLLNLKDISTIDPTNIALTIGIRQETAKALIEWLNEIEGTVEQHKANAGSFTEVKDEYILNIDDLETERNSR